MGEVRPFSALIILPFLIQPIPPHRIPFPAALGDADKGRKDEIMTESRTVGSGS
jgi:hypothetical protein